MLLYYVHRNDFTIFRFLQTERCICHFITLNSIGNIQLEKQGTLLFYSHHCYKKNSFGVILYYNSTVQMWNLSLLCHAPTQQTQDVGSMLIQRRRQWTNVKPPLIQRLVCLTLVQRRRRRTEVKPQLIQRLVSAGKEPSIFFLALGAVSQ